MRVAVSVVVLLGTASLLAACGGGDKSSSSASSGDTSSTASAPAEPTAPTSEEAKALLAQLPAAYQSADLVNGEMKFALCRSCHTLNPGGSDMTGPNLHGVFDRKAGAKEGYKYSDALKTSGLTWDAATLDKWVTDPRADVPGTKMSFLGIKNPKDRTDLIAYLKVATSAK